MKNLPIGRKFLPAQKVVSINNKAKIVTVDEPHRARHLLNLVRGARKF